LEIENETYRICSHRPFDSDNLVCANTHTSIAGSSCDSNIAGSKCNRDNNRESDNYLDTHADTTTHNDANFYLDAYGYTFTKTDCYTNARDYSACSFSFQVSGCE
jgi:hypothetical protein